MFANADGASRGHPGPAAYGAVVYDADDVELGALGGAIGRNTNNVAEYRGAIAAVEAALELGASEAPVTDGLDEDDGRRAQPRPLCFLSGTKLMPD